MWKRAKNSKAKIRSLTLIELDADRNLQLESVYLYGPFL